MSYRKAQVIISTYLRSTSALNDKIPLDQSYGVLIFDKEDLSLDLKTDEWLILTRRVLVA